MGNAISSCFSKYTTFSGRATRSEFWFFYLFYVIIYVIGAVVGIFVGNQYVVYFTSESPLRVIITRRGLSYLKFSV